MAGNYGFYFDSAKCTGCKTCQLACKDYKDLGSEVNFRRVYEYTGGTWQAAGDTWINSVFSYYVSISCNHCADPACVRVCPTGAMHQREADGIVAVSEDVCIGLQGVPDGVSLRRAAVRCAQGQHDQVQRLLRAARRGLAAHLRRILPVARAGFRDRLTN